MNEKRKFNCKAEDVPENDILEVVGHTNMTLCFGI